MQLLWKGLGPKSNPERFQSPGVGSWKGKWGGGRSLHWLWERNWHRKWSHMAQIYCVRDFPFKTHYIHGSEQCMAQPHSFLGLASDKIAVLLSGGGNFIIPRLERWWWNCVGKSSAVCWPSPLCWATSIGVIKASVSEAAGQEKRILLKKPKGNQDYLQGKENGKSFGSDKRKKLILAEEHVFQRWNNRDEKMFLFAFLFVFLEGQDPSHTELAFWMVVSDFKRFVRIVSLSYLLHEIV